MGRRKLTLGKHCKGSHFSWGERLKLQYYFAGSNGYRKERSPIVLGMIFQKSAKTIGRELQRGMVEHVLGDIPGVTIESLPRKGRLKRKKGHGGKRKHSNAEFAARSIELRPKEILGRLVAGHWEGDTVYSRNDGSKECLLTLVERSTRMELILKIPDRTAKSAKEAFDKLERQLGSRLFRLIFLSVTWIGAGFSIEPEGISEPC